MVVKVATTGLQWSQPIVPHSPSSSQTLACAISSRSTSSSRRRSRVGGDGAFLCRHVQRLQRSALFGTTPSPTRLNRSLSCDFPKPKFRTIRRSCSASLNSFDDEEFSKKLQELALRFQLADDDDEPVSASEPADIPERLDESSQELFSEPPNWSPPAEEIIPASVERRANSVELPVSLRMIKRKMQWEESLMEAGQSAYCSVKKAFSSMVFIIRELHSYTLQMREILFYEDLQGVLGRVQKEIHASFVWLFQQVFSHTPTLMVYVMILLANFTVYSMGHNAALAAAASASPSPPAALTETVAHHDGGKFDSSAVKTFSASSSGGGKTTSIGGGSGGGGATSPVASGTDGDGGVGRSDRYGAVVPEGASQSASSVGPVETETEAMNEEEVALWDSVVDEASEIEASVRDEALDRETVAGFVAPVSVEIESDAGYDEFIRTELVYQRELALDPSNPLLLANYAQFLYLVAHDYHRAEEYFKRATAVDPPDAEAHRKFATFLWRARNNLCAAETSFQEAINAEPHNAFYSGDYAHFLWNNGDEELETCFPTCPPVLLDTDHNSSSDAS